jgi:hypothetical protein
LIGAAALGSSGCDVEIGESTLGELGRVEFSYTSSCLFGCGLHRPLLPDSIGRISVSDPGDVDGLMVACQDAAVATATVERSCSCVRSGDGWATGAPVAADEACTDGFDKRCDNVVELAAHGAGSTGLELYQPGDGALIDRVTIHVREPHVAWLESDGVAVAPGAPVRLQVGQSDGIRVVMHDAEGRPLLVTGGVTWSIDDGQIAGFTQWFGGPTDRVETDDIVSVDGLRAGATELSVQAARFDVAFPLRVVE